MGNNKLPVSVGTLLVQIQSPLTRVRLKRQNCYKVVIVAVSLSLNTYLLITIIDLFAITVQFRLQVEVGLARTFRWSLTPFYMLS